MHRAQGDIQCAFLAARSQMLSLQTPERCLLPQAGLDCLCQGGIRAVRRRNQSRIRKDLRAAHSRQRGEAKDVLGCAVSLPDQSVWGKEHYAAGQVGKHGGADAFRSLGAAPFHLLHTLQFMFLLLQLLDDGRIGVQEKTLGCTRLIHKRRFLSEAPAHAPHDQCAHDKGKTCGEQHEHHAQHDRIGQQLHSNPQYQRRKRLPKKKATIAMLPRKTPKGIWWRRRAMAADSQARRRASRADSRWRAMRRRVRLIQTTRTVESPNSDPAIEPANRVKMVSLIPRNAPTIAMSLTSPKPMPSTPRARR